MSKSGIEWKVLDGELRAVVDGTPVVWFPQPGSQEAFLRCPIFEALYSGNRGGGKSDCLIMDFLQDVGRGYGQDWRGILFRRSFPQLDDLVVKLMKWVPKIFPKAQYNRQNHSWTWPDGESLLLRHIQREDDYYAYHGHCVREGEVLTPGGWVDIRDIKAGDIVYSVDKHRNMVKTPVAHKIEQMYSGDLVQHVGRGSFLEFTPEHGIGQVLPNGTLAHTKYNSLGYEAVVAAHVRFSGGPALAEMTIPNVDRTPGYESRTKNQPLTIFGDDFVEFMGWFLSEGNANADTHKVYIAQMKQGNRESIRNLLLRMHIDFGEDKSGFVFTSVDWASYLSQFGRCRDKFVPKEILSAPVDQLRIFFTALMGGDGSWQKENAYYFTTSRRLADDTSAIATKLGYKVYVSSRQRRGRLGLSYAVACRGGNRRDIRLRTDVRLRNRRSLLAEKVTRVPYTGKVYCIGLPENHLFVIRQRGCVWVSGNSYGWIAFDELTTWPDPGCYIRLFSLCRSTHPVVAKRARIRATTNPYGPGFNWVKKRFRLPMREDSLVGEIIKDSKNKAGDIEPPRVAIRSSLYENKILLFADPNYINRIRAAARNAAELAAWVEGSWDITSGGMFDDIWNDKIHVVPNIPYEALRNSGWKMDRAYDHGQTKPFSVGWWAESNGEPIEIDGRSIGDVPGDLILFDEYYGWNGEDDEGVNMSASEIAEGISQREQEMGLYGRIKRGPADSQIFAKMDGKNTVAGEMRKAGIYWDACDKGPGSRKQGWERIREYLKGAVPGLDGTREKPGLFVCSRCRQWQRTVPVLSRSEKDLDDIDTRTEDHCGDMTRYRLRWSRHVTRRRKW